MDELDAILIAGGGLTADGQLPPWTIARLEAALDHYQPGTLLLALSGGTVHKPPPTQEEGFPLFESRVAAQYLLENDIPQQEIITEISSYDTIGNAYFSRTIHIEPARLQTLLIITSQFHMDRLQVAFDWVYQLRPLPYPFQLTFLSTPNRGLDPIALQARQDKEAKSKKDLQEIIEEIDTIKKFHHWLFTQHAAYAVGISPSRITGETRDTY